MTDAIKAAIVANRQSAGKWAWPENSRQEHSAAYLNQVDEYKQHRKRLDDLLDRAGLNGWCERAEVVEAIEALIDAKLQNRRAA